MKIERDRGIGEALERLRKHEDYKALISAMGDFAVKLQDETMALEATPTLDVVRYSQGAFSAIKYMIMILENGYKPQDTETETAEQ